MSDTGLKSATTAANGDTGYNFTNLNNALSGTTTKATIGSSSVGDTSGIFNGFDFSAVGASDTVDGIELAVTLEDGFGDGGLVYGARLSWNGGTNYTSDRTTPTFRIPTSGSVNAKTTYTVGGPTSLWGRSWAVSELTSANFRVDIFMDASRSDFYTDDCWFYLIQAKVYYTAAGGGGSVAVFRRHYDMIQKKR